jgi:hypothetical protein
MTLFRLREWGPRHLLAAWGVWWVTIIGVAAQRAFGPLRAAAGAPEGTGNVSFGFGDGELFLQALREGRELYKWSMPLTSVVLWLALPPLAMWLVWLLTRDRTPPSAAPGERALPAGDADVTSMRSAPKERERR